MLSIFSINSPLWRFTDKVLHLLWLNFLWLLCSLPLVTMGASTTALYTVTLKYAKNQEGYMTREFFRAFRDNFAQSTVISFLLTGIGLFLGADLILYAKGTDTSPAAMVLLAAFCTCLLIYTFLNLYIYAVIAKFKNSTLQCLKNALILSLYHWPSSVTMAAAAIGILAVGLLLFPPLLFLGFSLFAYISSRLFARIFSLYEEKPAA